MLPSPHHLAAHLGREVGVSDWLEMTPARVQAFADATGDHQWIHLDAARAAAESPYGRPIAHGFLSLSMVSSLLRQCVQFGGLSMTVNYGLDRVRFPSAVPVGSRVRARFTPTAVERVSRGTQVTWHIVMEVEDASKPCCVADWIVQYHDAPGGVV